MSSSQFEELGKTFPPSGELVLSTIQQRKTDYHLVTLDQINSYLITGYLSSFYLTIFGICAGCLYSSWIALKQDGLSVEFMASLNVAKGHFIIFTILFILLSVGHIFWQQFVIKKNMFEKKI